jgi:RNase P protein component
MINKSEAKKPRTNKSKKENIHIGRVIKKPIDEMAVNRNVFRRKSRFPITCP